MVAAVPSVDCHWSETRQLEVGMTEPVPGLLENLYATERSGVSVGLGLFGSRRVRAGLQVAVEDQG